MLRGGSSRGWRVITRGSVGKPPPRTRSAVALRTDMAAFPTDLGRTGRLNIFHQQYSLNLFVTSASQAGSSLTDMGAALMSKVQTTLSRRASRSETLKNPFY
jgi:hypothetical protein